MCCKSYGFMVLGIYTDYQKLCERYSNRLNFALILGGLRSGTNAAALRRQILHYWHNVQRSRFSLTVI